MDSNDKPGAYETMKYLVEDKGIIPTGMCLNITIKHEQGIEMYNYISCCLDIHKREEGDDKLFLHSFLHGDINLFSKIEMNIMKLTLKQFMILISNAFNRNNRKVLEYIVNKYEKVFDFNVIVVKLIEMNYEYKVLVLNELLSQYTPSSSPHT